MRCYRIIDCENRLRREAYGAPMVLAAFSLTLAVSGTTLASEYRHADEAIGDVEAVYSGHLTPDMAVNTYRNIDRLFPSRVIEAGDSPRELPPSEASIDGLIFEVDEEQYDIYDYLALNNVTGLLVLKDGEVVYETYQRGNDRDTRWMSMSIAKSISSTLAGMAIKDGLIDGLDAQVVDYVPALEGS